LSHPIATRTGRIAYLFCQQPHLPDPVDRHADGALSQTERVGMLRSGWRRFVAWREARRAIRDLGALDDRLLQDMGIARSQITGAALGLDVDLGRRRNLHE